ncbi:MAG: DegT/DnrJ/EryC1/StrS family aminotransferase, partial [Selenomonadaceae bacterium]|nr:DegT/DnrJ/EryC1/StrS family aminotransferase [Selenomonadaceae bacterium]
IMAIADKHGIFVIEDAAQGVDAKYGDKYLGTIGHLGCYSFHETKNYTCGEGGALVVNDPQFIKRAEILREKGTNRAMFLRGEVDKYTWTDMGSSFLLSDLNAAFLYAQLADHQKIYDYRMKCWNAYYEGLLPLQKAGKIELPAIPEGCAHNAHMFYIKAKDLNERTKLMAYLKENGIAAVFHYVPLHSAIAGKKFSYFSGKDEFTTAESDRLLRLPLHTNLSDEDINKVISYVKKFYEQ